MPKSLMSSSSASQKGGRSTPPPRMFGRPATFQLTDALKAALEERLNRMMLMARVSVFIFAVLGAFALFSVADFACPHDTLVPAVFFIRQPCYPAGASHTAGVLDLHQLIGSVLCS